MPIERKAAEEIIKLVEQSGALCNASLKTIKVNESLGHVQVYGRLVSFFLGHSYTNLLAPIWKAFPDLEPEQMKEPYVEPVPSLTPESMAALAAFVAQATEANAKIKSLLGEAGLNTLPYGGFPEVERSVAEIQEFLAHPRFRDENPE